MAPANRKAPHRKPSGGTMPKQGGVSTSAKPFIGKHTEEKPMVATKKKIAAALQAYAPRDVLEAERQAGARTKVREWPGRTAAMAVMERLRGAKGFDFEKPLASRLAPADLAERTEKEILRVCAHLAVLFWLRITYGSPNRFAAEPVPKSPIGGAATFSPSGKLLGVWGSIVAHPDYPLRAVGCAENTSTRLGCLATRSTVDVGWHGFNNLVLAEVDQLAAEFARLNPSLFAKGAR